MRYIVRDFMLDNDHPQWPNQIVYYIFDLAKKRFSLACYTTYDRAKEVADRNNKRCILSTES